MVNIILDLEDNKEKSGRDSDNDSDILKREIHFDEENSQISDRNKWDKGKLKLYQSYKMFFIA